MTNLMYHTILNIVHGRIIDEVREPTEEEVEKARNDYKNHQCMCKIVHDIEGFSLNERYCAFCGHHIRYVDVGKVEERHPKMFKRTHGGS